VTAARDLFLVWHGADAVDVTLDEPNHSLKPNLLLIRSARTRSKLYHSIKRQLPDGTALLVAPLADAPKFEGMAQGSLTWLESGG